MIPSRNQSGLFFQHFFRVDIKYTRLAPFELQIENGTQLVSHHRACMADFKTLEKS